MKSKNSSNGPSLLAVFFIISALVTPPIMWLILLLHAKPEDWGAYYSRDTQTTTDLPMVRLCKCGGLVGL